MSESTTAKPTDVSFFPDCVAVPGKRSICDIINPDTGKGHYSGKTVEELQKEYPGAVKINTDEHMRQLAAAEAEAPRTWTETTEETYTNMLEVLPPAAWHRGGFLVGEAMDHSAKTGRPRFECYKQQGGKYFVLSCPITHAEFCEIFGRTAYCYQS